MVNDKIVRFKVKKKYEKANDFKRYYVTGAIGGFKNPYDFRLSFFNVDSNDFTLKTQNLKDKNELSDEDLSKKLSEIEMTHLIQCELIISEQAVREIYNFIGKELEALEKIKKLEK